ADWADDQIAPRALGNDACLQCHTPVARGFQPRSRGPETAALPDITPHTRHRAGSSGSSCYNCHMPHTTYGLLKTIRSHQISSPSVQTTLATGRPNACNLCHLDKTLGWTAQYLDAWYGLTPPTLGDDELSVAASLVWLLEGDAGQRAMIAQSMGWAA